MEAFGLVVRRKEGKSVFVFPTAEGRKKDRSIRAAWAALYGRYAKVLGKRGSDGLTAAIYGVVERLEA